MNPYEVLGIDPGADKSQVRKAYRKAAARTHPDAGGTAEKFALVKRAASILEDDARRERYDRTGKVDEPEPDNHLARALVLVDTAFGIVGQKIGREGRTIEKEPRLIQRMQAELEVMLRQSFAQKAEIATAIERQERLLGRFSAKSGPNRLEALLVGRLGQLRAMLPSIDRDIEAMKEAIKVVKDHDFRADQPQQEQQMFLQWGMTASPMVGRI